MNDERYSGAHRADDGALVKFEMHAASDYDASEAAGRPIRRDVPYIWKFAPGDKGNIVHRPVRDSDKKAYPRLWDAFEAGREAPIEGTALTEWPPMPRSLAEDLAYDHVRTVEQLAALPDGSINRPGVQAFKQKAISWLKTAREGASAERLAAELAERDARLQALEAQNAELMAMAKKLMDEKGAPRPRGRPPKAKAQVGA